MNLLENLARTVQPYMAAAGFFLGACTPIAEQLAPKQPTYQSMDYGQLEKKAMGILGIRNKTFLKSAVVDKKPYFFGESGIDLMMGYCEGTAKFSVFLDNDGGMNLSIEKRGDNSNQPLKEAIIAAVDKQGNKDQILDQREKTDYLKGLILERVSCPKQ